MNNNKMFNSINSTFYTLFGFILALFSAWSWQLLPHQLIEVFDSNRKAQLIVLFMLIMFTINLFSPEVPLHNIVMKSIFLFFLYLAITKQSLKSFIIMMVCLTLNAIISNYIEYYKLQLKKVKSHQEHTLIQHKIDMLHKTLNGALVITISVIVYGVGNYLTKQYQDHYKPGQNIGNFLLKFLFEGGKMQRKVTGNVL
jgi:hypothetical protein